MNVKYLSPEEFAEQRRKFELQKKVKELDPEWVKNEQKRHNEFINRTV